MNKYLYLMDSYFSAGNRKNPQDTFPYNLLALFLVQINQNSRMNKCSEIILVSPG